MPGNRPTIKNVAMRAGVSTATVSNVFSGSKPVNKELRERVLKAAQELSYQVDRAASQLRSGQARVVGILVPDLDDTFFTSLISRLEVMAGQDGYDVVISSSRDDVGLEQSRLTALLGWRPAGLIAVPCTDVIPSILVDEARRLPLVLADRVVSSDIVADTVIIDNFDAGEIAARHLISRGHRNIVIAASHLLISPIRERIRGVESFVREALGHSPIVTELGSNSERGAEIFANWLERNHSRSAVVALTNVTTLGVLSALASQKIEMPADVSIIGFDDYPWMSARKTALTAIKQPVDEMASKIWERLKIRMGGDDSPPKLFEFNTSLKVRDSVCELSETERQEASDSQPAKHDESGRNPKAIH